jgi:ABC-type transport system involved in multi-copper enzyme maturation permease subunit
VSDFDPSELNEDVQHLRLLAVLHTVCAVLGALLSCLFVIHIAMGLSLLNGGPFFPTPPNGPPMPPFFAWMMIAMGTLAVVCGWAVAIATWLSGRFIRQRRHRVYSFVIAGLLCGFFPFGTGLGVFAIVMLSKASVRALYEGRVTSTAG